jgi:hypothetical protein
MSNKKPPSFGDLATRCANYQYNLPALFAPSLIALAPYFHWLGEVAPIAAKFSEAMQSLLGCFFDTRFRRRVLTYPEISDRLSLTV